MAEDQTIWEGICGVSVRVARRRGLLALLSVSSWFASLLTTGFTAAYAQRVQIPNTPPSAYGAPIEMPPQAIAPPVYGDFPAGTTIGPPQVVTSPYVQQPGFGPPPAPPVQTYTQPQVIAPSESPWVLDPNAYTYQPGDTSLVSYTKFCQGLDFEYTHLFGGGGAKELQLDRVEISSTFAWPLFGQIDSPLLISPGFVFNFFDGSALAPFPGTVYDAYIDTAWYPRVSETCGLELGFRTGVWSDLQKVNSDSVRFLGRALVSTQVSPTSEIVIGVVYLDRREIKLLPAGGMRCRPSPNLEISAVFPNPRVRGRMGAAGATDWWWFVAGEYGGGSWTNAAQPNGFDYNDVRVSLGVDFETQNEVTGFLEVGYVFDRHYYLAGGVSPDFDETVMLRAGLNL